MSWSLYEQICLQDSLSLNEKRGDVAYAEFTLRQRELVNGLQTKHKSKNKGARKEKSVKGKKNSEKEFGMQNTRAQYKE